MSGIERAKATTVRREMEALEKLLIGTREVLGIPEGPVTATYSQDKNVCRPTEILRTLDRLLRDIGRCQHLAHSVLDCAKEVVNQLGGESRITARPAISGSGGGHRGIVGQKVA